MVVVEEDAVDSGQVGLLAHVAVLRNPLRLWEDGLRFHGTGCGGSTTLSQGRGVRPTTAPMGERISIAAWIHEIELSEVFSVETSVAR